MHNLERSKFNRFGVSILAFAAALAIRIWGGPFFGSVSPFLLFFSALALASWYGGVGPGVLVTCLGAISAAILSLPIITGNGAFEAVHIIHICAFVATGLFISILMGKLHGAIESSKKAESELEDRVRKRTADLAKANEELQTEKSKLMGILDQMREAVYIVNPEYGIEYANPAMEREFGKVEGRKCYQYLEGSNDTICARCKNPEVFEGKSFIQEWVSPRNNKVYDCFDTPIVLGNGVQCKLRIMHDITGLKKAELELREKHTQIQRLSSELLTAQESERMRISRELHDELGQSLTLIKLKVGLIEMALTESQVPLKNLCGDTAAHVDQAIENMRRLSRDLSPVTIETLGITRALKRLAEDFNKTGTIKVEQEIYDIDGLFPMQSNVLLYRVLQEGLNNIVKHSGAGAARVTVKREKGRVQFGLEDDGNGIHFAEGNQRERTVGGLGLTFMSERVRTLGGILQIENLNGRGTRLSFVISAGSGEDKNGKIPVDSGR